jgi:hypothetical protein
MTQFGGKDSKRHFTVVIGGKEHGLYISSTPSSAARKAVTKLCAANKSKKVEFSIREITQGSKKKTYGPYEGYIEKLKEPIELKGRVIKYKPVAKLSGKKGVMKGGIFDSIFESIEKLNIDDFLAEDESKQYVFKKNFTDPDKLFFGTKFEYQNKKYYPFVLVFKDMDFAAVVFYIDTNGNLQRYNCGTNFLLGLGDPKAYKEFNNNEKQKNNKLMDLGFLKDLGEINLKNNNNKPIFPKEYIDNIKILTG